MKILITGAAGFIGFHLAKRFLATGTSVFGLDNLNDYYSVDLKKDRLKLLQQDSNFHFEPIDLADGVALDAYFKANEFTHVVNLAAQAGVRYSLLNPKSYIDSNIVGFANLLECCRHNGTRHLVYASSSSVYGLNTSMPFSVHDNVDHPVSLYAASKKSNELMAHTYSYLYKLPTTGLRFFTVYGPWGRPDMALYLFTKAICENKPINVFNHGKMRRDFTYIDDIVEGVFRIVSHVPQGNPAWDGKNPDPSTSPAPYKLYNIGNNNTVELEQFITVLENALGRKAVRNYMDIQPGDVPATYANIDDLIKEVGFKPSTSIEEGIEKFIAWYKDYYRP
ncbi:MAG: capsular biosynthesis protein CpsI [Deltaproteobacteria bacterium HGW-Deltaproteobacteria-18]|nr:MAG: capsular biosynthesis protein CpsI [Deltaproteobacteria bacterium HGW-Deltaproteobacteria-18]